MQNNNELILLRILTWGTNPILDSFLSFGFIKGILLILTKMCLHSICLGMSIMALMFFTILPGHDEISMADVYWRGLCEQQVWMDQKRFCLPPEVLTLTQATLGMPTLYITLFYLPTALYVFIVTMRKANKSMSITEQIVMFNLSMFTNMFFTKSKQQPGAQRDKHAWRRRNVRSSSLEGSSFNYKKLVKYTRSVSCPNLPLEDSSQEVNQPNFSLYHSNILYSIQFIGFLLILLSDVAVGLKRGGRINIIGQFYIGVFVANLALWIDLNVTMFRKRRNSMER